jgi:hypothetical protein
MTNNEFEPAKYRDEYRERALALLDEKRKGHEITPPAPTAHKPAPVTISWKPSSAASAPRFLGAARSANVAQAGADVERLTQLQGALVDAKQSYWAEQVDIQIRLKNSLGWAAGRPSSLSNCRSFFASKGLVRCRSNPA